MKKQKKPLVLKPEGVMKALTKRELEMVSGGFVPKQPDNGRSAPSSFDDDF